MADIKMQMKKDRAVVTLGGELTVRHAQKMKAALSEALAGRDAVEVVLGAIVSLDSSLPQLLCSAHRTAAEDNKTLTVSGADQEGFADLLRRCGFIRHTGCRDSTRTTCLWLRGPVSE